MSQGLKGLFKNGFLYSISSVLQRASSIILFPIFTAYLTKHDYGILSYSNSLGSLLLILALVELPRAMGRLLYSSADKDRTHLYKVVGTVLVAGIVCSTIISLAVIGLSKWLLQPYLGNISFYPYILFTIVNVPLQTLYSIYISYVKFMQKGKVAFVTENVYFLLNIGFNLFFVVIMHTDVIGLIYSTIIANLVMAIHAFRVFYRRVIKYFSWDILKQLYKISLGLFLFIVLGSLAEYADNFFLNRYSGADSLGIFYIATTFAGIFSFIKEAFLSSFTPYYYNLNKQGELNEKTNKVVLDVLLLIGFFAIGISMFNSEVISVLSNNKELVDARRFIPLLVGGLLMIFVSQLVNISIMLKSELVRFFVIITIVSLIVNVLGDYWFIPMYGLMGLTLVKVLAYSAQLVVSIILNLRIEKERRMPVVQMWLIASFIFTVCLLYYIPFNSYWLGFIFRLGIFLGYSILLYFYFSKKYQIEQRIRAQITHIFK
jgi:O-antigen/teichoic acid export membrane protein